MENKIYTYKEIEYKWIKPNFEYRIWSKTFIHKYEIFERTFTKDSKEQFLKEFIGEETIPNALELETKFNDNPSVKLISSTQDYMADIKLAKELFLYEPNNIKNLLENTLEGFTISTDLNDDALIELALEVLDDFFTKMQRQSILSIK